MPANKDGRIISVIATFIAHEVGVTGSPLIRLQAQDLLDHMRQHGLVVSDLNPWPPVESVTLTTTDETTAWN